MGRVCYTEPSAKSPVETVWKRGGRFPKNTWQSSTNQLKIPLRKAFSAVLRSSFNEEVLASSDVTVAIAAATQTSQGAAIAVFFERTSRFSLSPHLGRAPKTT